MSVDLFAGVPVRDYDAAVAWYTRLLGAEPAFLPNATEAVWALEEHRFVYVDVRPEHAGHAMHTLFISDFDARIALIAERGLEPAERETYANGTRKVVFRDPDGNEIGFGGAPAEDAASNQATQQPGGASAAAAASDAGSPTASGAATTSVVRLYAGDDGQSHLEEVQLRFDDGGDQSALAELVPGGGIEIGAPMREFLVWVAFQPRTHADAIEAWASHCPRFTQWEDALDAGLVQIEGGRHTARVQLTARGRTALDPSP